LGLGGLPALGNVGAWDVRVRSNFGSGASAYSSAYGPTQRIQVAGTSASGELEYEIVDAERSEELEIQSGWIFPNPSTGNSLNVQLDGLNANQVSLRIVDAMGRVVFTQQFAVEGMLNTSVDFGQSLAAGIYTVELTDQDVVKTEKLIIQK
jgi:hypothetical protein